MNGMMQMMQMMQMSPANTTNVRANANTNTNQTSGNQQQKFNSVLDRTMKRTGSSAQPQSQLQAQQSQEMPSDTSLTELSVLTKSLASSATSLTLDEVDVSEDLLEQVKLLTELLGQLQDTPEKDIPKELILQIEELLVAITANIHTLPEKIDNAHLLEILEQGVQAVSGAKNTRETWSSLAEHTAHDRLEQPGQAAVNSVFMSQQEAKGDLNNSSNLPNPGSQEQIAVAPASADEEEESLIQQLKNMGPDKKADSSKDAKQSTGAINNNMEAPNHNQRAVEQIAMIKANGEPIVNITDKTAQVLDKQLEQLFGQQREELASSLKEQTLHNVKLIMNEGRSEITFQLYPKELGSLTLKVNVDKGIVMAKFAAASYLVKGVIESSLPQLRQSLEDLGMKDARLEVGVGQQFLGEGRQGQPKQKASGKIGQSTEKKAFYSDDQLGIKVNGLLRQGSTFEYVV